MNDTLYNLTFGALGALVILLAFNIARSVGKLRPLTWVRNLTRRVLGVAAFEETTFNELYIYRTDVDRWTRDTQASTRRNADAITSVREDVATRMAADRTRNNRVRTEVEEMGILLRSYVEALGPLWTTAQGHKMPLRLLSTGHLRNIRDGGFTRNRNVQEFIESELERRRIDAGYRVDAAAGKPAPTRQQMKLAALANREATRIEVGSLLALDAGTQERVSRVLPLWAVELITDLRNRRTKRLNVATQSRLFALPFWAQELIHDLVRRVNR